MPSRAASGPHPEATSRQTGRHLRSFVRSASRCVFAHALGFLLCSTAALFLFVPRHCVLPHSDGALLLATTLTDLMRGVVAALCRTFCGLVPSFVCVRICRASCARRRGRSSRTTWTAAMSRGRTMSALTSTPTSLPLWSTPHPSPPLSRPYASYCPLRFRMLFTLPCLIYVVTNDVV